MSKRCANFFSWSFFLALLFPASSFSADGAKDEKQVVESLQKSYDAIVDFVVEFRQETEIKALGRTLKSQGKVYFKRPGKMLWSYDEPKGQFVLADGKNLYFYQPDQGQALKTPFTKAFRSDVPASFLLGLGNLKRDFKTTLKGLEKENYVLHLRPKGEEGEIGEILLGVEPRTFDIVWVRIRDAVQNLTAIRFSNMRKSVGLKDSLFWPKIPEGTEVMELK